MSRAPRRARSLTEALAPEAPAAIETPAPMPKDDADTTATAQTKPIGVMLYVSPDDHAKMRDLSYHSRVSLQKLGIEAWNLLMQNRGLPPLTGLPASGAKAPKKPG